MKCCRPDRYKAHEGYKLAFLVSLFCQRLYRENQPPLTDFHHTTQNIRKLPPKVIRVFQKFDIYRVWILISRTDFRLVLPCWLKVTKKKNSKLFTRKHENNLCIKQLFKENRKGKATTKKKHKGKEKRKTPLLKKKFSCDFNNRICLIQ